MACTNCKAEDEFTKSLRLERRLKSTWIEQIANPGFCQRCKKIKVVWRPYTLKGQIICYDCYPKPKEENNA